ncbi:MAG TPA: hypothetical protein VMG40_03780 [Bryobacteraceae bacterium]|nr:hypothetical protein [Bryobacteraceae bacterium]
MTRTHLYLHWRDRNVARRFRRAVSLHSHTLYSRESLAFIPRYTSKVPLLGEAIRRHQRRYRERTGRELDFSRAFLRPPLAPREALELERAQIENVLDLDPLVSLSDHDDIQAGALLAVLNRDAPISVEWTVPFGPSFFHIGIHNLPAARAQATMRELQEVTAAPTRERISQTLAAVHEFPGALVVWNHPAWDEARIGSIEHAQLLGQFLERFGEWIHALELNGLRPWRENRLVIRVAGRSGHPLISGGDRHGTEPNANLNLTNAQNFAEFAEEIRRDRHSDVLFMPQYREPLRLRMIETMHAILRDYPEFPAGRRYWRDRVFYTSEDGSVQPLSAAWRGEGPWIVQAFVAFIRASRIPQLRGALRLALADAPEIAP